MIIDIYIYIYILILFVLFVIGFLPVIKADYYYEDDMARAVQGYRGWDNYSRYTTNELSRIIHVDNHIFDITPLTQLLSCVLLALSGVILIKLISGKKEIKLIDLIAVIPIGLSPFFLQCISFKFDCVYMALSIFAAIVPFAVYYKNKKAFSIISILGILVVCTTYQAANGIYLMIVLFLALKEWNSGLKTKEVAKNFLLSIGLFLVALLIFKFFIMKNVDYGYAATTISPIAQIIPNTINHLLQYFDLIINNSKKVWLLLIGIVAIMFVIINTCESKRNKAAAAVASGVTVILMAVMCFIMYSILETPIFYMRSTYSVGVFIAIMSVYSVTHARIFVPKIAAIALAWVFIVFAAIYGNALSVQKEWTNFRIEQVASDLKNIETIKNREENYIQIEGCTGYASQIKTDLDFNKMLKKLVPITFCKKGYNYGSQELRNFYGFDNLRVKPDLDFTEMDMSVEVDNYYHRILTDKNGHILIELK